MEEAVLAVVKDDEVEVDPEAVLSLSSFMKGLASVGALSLMAFDSCLNN